MYTAYMYLTVHTQLAIQVAGAPRQGRLMPCVALTGTGLVAGRAPQRAQYPLIKEYTLNYGDLNVMI